MQALVLTLGLLMTHLATTFAVAVAVPPALRSSVSIEDSNAALPVLEPLEPMVRNKCRQSIRLLCSSILLSQWLLGTVEVQKYNLACRCSPVSTICSSFGINVS